MKSKKIKKLSLCAIFVAIIAATAFISLPTPFGVSLTMQIFGVSLAGFCLGAKGGVAATAVYIASGAVGLPVFSSFSGGIGVLIGPSGGFIWGFIFVAIFSAFGTRFYKKLTIFAFFWIGILICHALGVVQYSIVLGVNPVVAFVTASLPFLLKDFIVVFLSFLVWQKIKSKIKG